MSNKNKWFNLGNNLIDISKTAFCYIFNRKDQDWEQ